MVASRVGGIPEIISDGEQGLLVEGRETLELACSCLKVMHEEHLRLSMGESASRRIQSGFSSIMMVETYKKIYQGS